MCAVLKRSWPEALDQLWAPVVKSKICPILMNFRKGKQAAADSKDQVVLMKAERKPFLLGNQQGIRGRTLLPGLLTTPCSVDLSQ